MSFTDEQFDDAYNAFADIEGSKQFSEKDREKYFDEYLLDNLAACWPTKRAQDN